MKNKGMDSIMKCLECSHTPAIVWGRGLCDCCMSAKGYSHVRKQCESVIPSSQESISELKEQLRKVKADNARLTRIINARGCPHKEPWVIGTYCCHACIDKPV